MASDKQSDQKQKVENLPGSVRAAIILLILGEEISSSIFRKLTDEEIRKVSQAISSLGIVKDDIASAVMNDTHKELTSGSPQLHGSLDYAKKVLESAFNRETAQSLLRNITHDRGSGEGLKVLRQADPRQLSKLIQNEHPQSIALIVSNLDSSQAAATLGLLPETTRFDVCMRLARMDQISQPIQDKVIGMIADRLDDGVQSNLGTSDGVRLVAEILNRMDRNVSRMCLEMIENDNPNLALSIRNKMFVFDDILLMGDKDIRTIIQRVDKQVLVRALKGTHEELREHFFRNMSQRAIEMLKEDMEAMGPIRLKDAEEAQQEIVATIRSLEGEGAIDLGGEGGDEYVV